MDILFKGGRCISTIVRCIMCGECGGEVGGGVFSDGGDGGGGGR